MSNRRIHNSSKWRSILSTTMALFLHTAYCSVIILQASVITVEITDIVVNWGHLSNPTESTYIMGCSITPTVKEINDYFQDKRHSTSCSHSWQWTCHAQTTRIITLQGDCEGIYETGKDIHVGLHVYVHLHRYWLFLCSIHRHLPSSFK
jgi:hypothetical protein